MSFLDGSKTIPSRDIPIDLLETARNINDSVLIQIINQYLKEKW